MKKCSALAAVTVVGMAMAVWGGDPRSPVRRFDLPVSSWVIAAPVPADLDGDGQLELVVRDTAGTVRAWSTNVDPPTVMWEYRPSYGEGAEGAGGSYGPFLSPAVGDLDGDGCVEVIVARDAFIAPGALDVIAGLTGELLWRYLWEPDESIETSPLVADFNHDRDRELEVAVGVFDRERNTSRLDVVTRRHFPGSGGRLVASLALPGLEFPALIDVDGDGTTELAVAYLFRSPLIQVVRFTPAWDFVPIWSVVPTAQLVAAPSIGDLNGDGVPEVVVGTRRGVAAYQVGAAGPLMDVPLHEANISITPFPLADIDQDGRVEVVAVAWALDASTIVVVRYDPASPQGGEVMWSYPVANTDLLPENYVVADVNGNGMPEVIFVAAPANEMAAVEDGRVVWSGGRAGAGLRPVVCDFEGDGRQEVIVMGDSLIANTSPVRSGPVEWPSAYHDVHNTSSYGYVAPAIPARFVRGDANGSRVVTITDPIVLLTALFSGGASLDCLDAADADDNGAVNIGDPIYLLSFLFLGGPAPPPPFPDLGDDPSRDLLECSRLTTF